MKEIRNIGNHLKKISDKKGISIKKISDTLNISENAVELVMAGRIILSYPQLQKIADLFGLPISDFINTSETDYSLFAMDCMNNFTKKKNCEDIIDMIYDYLDVVDSLS